MILKRTASSAQAWLPTGDAVKSGWKEEDTATTRVGCVLRLEIIK